MRLIKIALSLAFVISLDSSIPSLYADDTKLEIVSRAALEQVMNQVHEAKLSNGMRVLLYKRGEAPVFTGMVATRVGGSDEKLGATGIAHMLEHMAFKGTPDIGTNDYARERVLLEELEAIVSRGGTQRVVLPEDQARWQAIHSELKTLWASESFTREYEKRGASGMNATTDVELTRYFVSLPRSAFDFWAWAESERLLHPVMRQFYQERDVVMEERRMRYDNDPGGKLYETLLGQAFTAHPYRNPVIGYPQDINSLTATMMSDFHKAYYVPDNIVVAVVGDIDVKRDLATLERYFGRLPRAIVPARPTQVEPPQDGERQFTVSMDSAPEMMIAYHKPAYPDPVDPPLSILFEVLAGSPISPLYDELVRKQRIATSVASEEAPGNAYPNLVIFSMSPRSPHTNKELLAAFDKVLNDFIERGVTKEQLENAKRSIAMSYLGQLRSSESMASQLAAAELTYNNWRVISKWYDEVMNVTGDDVMRVARQYLKPENRTIGFLETAVPAKNGEIK